MFKDKNLKAYDVDYYKRQSHMRNEYTLIAQWINENIESNLFGDVGCGEGYLITDLFNKHKKEVWGVDGSPSFENFVDINIRDRIKKIDLTKKHNLENAEVTISMEVGEHLPEKASDTFVKNITSTNASIIMFSAAPPGQDGTNHINLQFPEYWETKFNKLGYKLNKELTNKFKNDLKSKLEYAWWYINNIMILEKS